MITTRQELAARLTHRIARNIDNLYIFNENDLVLTEGGKPIELKDIKEHGTYRIELQCGDALSQDPNQTQKMNVLISPDQVYRTTEGGICFMHRGQLFANFDFSQEIKQGIEEKENGARAWKLKFAMETAKNQKNLSYVEEILRQKGLSFGHDRKETDPLLRTAYSAPDDALKSRGINVFYLSTLTKQDLNEILTEVDTKVRAEIDRQAKSLLDRIYAENADKPVVLIDSLTESDIDVLRTLSGRYGLKEIQSTMILKMELLGAPPANGLETRLNMAYRIIDNIDDFSRHSTMRNNAQAFKFTTDDAYFINCSNKMVAQRLAEMHLEHLREQGRQAPQIGGVVGVLQAMAEHSGREQPESFKEFTATAHKTREEALTAAQRVFEECEKKGLPIYISAKDTCFKSLDGGFHNYPILMVPGDKISLKSQSEEILTIGENQSPVPEEMTVLGVSVSDHGALVMTDAGIFTLGGMGEDIVAGYAIMQRENQEIQLDALDHGFGANIDAPVIDGEEFEGPTEHGRS